MKKKIKLREKENYPKKESRMYYVLVLLILLVVLALTVINFLNATKKPNMITGPKTPQTQEQATEETNQLLDIEAIKSTIKKPLAGSNYVELFLPAVDSENKGVMTLLVVEALPGSGRTLVDVDNLLFWTDTQNSIRKAKKVAEIKMEEIREKIGVKVY